MRVCYQSPPHSYPQTQHCIGASPSICLLVRDIILSLAQAPSRGKEHGFCVTPDLFGKGSDCHCPGGGMQPRHFCHRTLPSCWKNLTDSSIVGLENSQCSFPVEKPFAGLERWTGYLCWKKSLWFWGQVMSGGRGSSGEVGGHLWWKIIGQSWGRTISTVRRTSPKFLYLYLTLKAPATF